MPSDNYRYYHLDPDGRLHSQSGSPPRVTSRRLHVMGYQMRALLVGLAALLLSACDSEETYQMAPIEAFTALSGIGMPSGLSPLPGGLSPVSVNVESVPGDNSVQWLLTHDGDDIARIAAKVTPDGDTASTVTVKYVEGTAPGDKWRNEQARRLIRDEVQRLVVEAVDSTLEKRPYDKALSNEVRRQVTTASPHNRGRVHVA